MPPTTTRASRTASTWQNVFTNEEHAAVQAPRESAEVTTSLSPEEEHNDRRGRRFSAKIAGMPDSTIERWRPDPHAGPRDHPRDAGPSNVYGIPAYASDGKVICFFEPDVEVRGRYSTFEFQPDQGSTMARYGRFVRGDEADPRRRGTRIVELVKKASGWRGRLRGDAPERSFSMAWASLFDAELARDRQQQHVSDLDRGVLRRAVRPGLAARRTSARRSPSSAHRGSRWIRRLVRPSEVRAVAVIDERGSSG